MIETVFSLLFIIPILFLIFFFGKGIVKVQHAQVVDRYVAWQIVPGGPGPSADPDNQNVLLNKAFFDGKAQSITYDAITVLPQGDDTNASPTALTNAGQLVSNDTGTLMSKAFEEFPSILRATFTTSLPSEIAFWEQFDRPITHMHQRIDNEWKFVNSWTKKADGTWVESGDGPWMLYPVRDALLLDIESQLKILENMGDPLGTMMRSVYSAKPGYAGPTVPTTF